MKSWFFLGRAENPVYGYELPLSFYKKFRQLPFEGQDLREKFGIPDPEAFHILLAHNPVYFDTYAAWGADLTLSGHLHGGIIRIPGNWRIDYTSGPAVP